MGHYKYILDPGHGGMKNGHYTTAPAKMWTFEDGVVIHEGVINRRVTALLAIKLQAANIKYMIAADEEDDTPLSARVKLADDLFNHDKSWIYLSIHSNSGKGKGIEVFTSPGQTKSDTIAQYFIEAYKTYLPEFLIRKDLTDGDWDKEADFYVLRKTDCPSVLVENLFFDNRNEAEFLMSDAGQERIASCLFHAIQQIEIHKPI